MTYSDASKRRWADPELRAKMLAGARKGNEAYKASTSYRKTRVTAYGPEVRALREIADAARAVRQAVPYTPVNDVYPEWQASWARLGTALERLEHLERVRVMVVQRKRMEGEER